MNYQTKIITCTMFSLYFFITIIFSLFYINLFLNKTLILFDENTYNNVIPDNIELSSSLKNYTFSKNLLDIYIKEHDYFNIYVLFEPIYWASLKNKDKKKIKEIISKKWIRLYKKKHGDNTLLVPKIKIGNKG